LEFSVSEEKPKKPEERKAEGRKGASALQYRL
jgi:hypothetical protein